MRPRFGSDQESASCPLKPNLPSSALPARAFVTMIRDGLAGEDENLAQGPLPRAIPLLAIPMVLEMAMESLFAICDVFFVAKLGAASVAAVGLTESLVALVYAVAFGLAMPTGAMVARRIGEDDKDGASVAASQAVWLAIFVGLLLATSAYFGPELLTLMGADRDVLEVGVGFTTLTLLSAPIVTLIFVQGAVFRGAGDATRAMRAVWLANGINLVLDPCLIFGLGPFPELGVTGAALATLIGRGIGVAYQFAHLWRGPLVEIAKHWRFDVKVASQIGRLSIGGTVQHLVETGSWVAMVRIVAELGSVAVAAYTITTRLIMFFLMPAWGFSNATATLVGQSLGAKDPKRAERAVWLSGAYASPFLFVVTVFFLAIPERVAGWFSSEPDVVAIAGAGLFVVAFGYVFYGWQMVTQQAFNGAGDTKTPAWINVGCFWGLQIPLAYLLAHPAGYGTVGIFASAAISYTVAAGVGVMLVRRGRWKATVV
ncbi:MAG: MATE family efflux transporter [Deltaproteobacteria bacterium]